MDSKLDITKNPGLIIQDPSIYDYVQGKETGIAYKVNMPDGNWSKYLGFKENQKFFLWDTDECCTLSQMNVLEIIFNWLRATGQFSTEALAYFQSAGYIDETGSFAFSERFSAIMNGTTINGNSHYVVWNAVRQFGLLPRRDLNYTVDRAQSFGSQEAMCNDYYDKSVVTSDMKVKAVNIFKYVDIQWEWVAIGQFDATPAAALLAGLKQSPLHIGTPVCPDWNDGDVQTCSSQLVQHATTLYGRQSNGKWNIMDHYNPFLKTFDADYCIPYAVKAVVTPKVAPTPAPVQTFHYTFNPSIALREGSRGDAVTALQTILKIEGLFTLQPTGYFGVYTEAAVNKLQLKYADQILKPLGLTAPTGAAARQTLTFLNTKYAS